MILLNDIIGHGQIVKTLKGAVASGRVGHAYLFSGPRGVGKMTAAVAFACALMCEAAVDGDGCGGCSGCLRAAGGMHPDVRVVTPGGATVKIGQVRDLISGLQAGPSSGRWAVRIVDEADTMTQEAANALLKTLEEPVSGAVIILVTTRPQAMIQTILSRCQHMYFQPLLKPQIVKALAAMTGNPEEEVSLAASLAGGSLGKALGLFSGGLQVRDRAAELVRKLGPAGVGDVLALVEGLPESREEVVPLLEMMVLWFRDILLYNETGNPGYLFNTDRRREIGDLAGQYSTGRLLEMIADIEQAKGSLAASANVQLALEALFLRLAGMGPEVGRREESVL